MPIDYWACLLQLIMVSFQMDLPTFFGWTKRSQKIHFYFILN